MALTNINGLVPLRQYYQEFNSSGTWTCPTGTTLVDVVLVGGGGGGGAVHSITANQMGASGGGGGGEVKKVSVPVTAGTTYTITVGAGGSGSTVATAPPVSGGNGGDSSFGLTRTLANGHYYNHEFAYLLATWGNSTTNSHAFTMPGGWFSKNVNSGYSLTSPYPYNSANATNTNFATTNTAAMVATGVPSGWNGAAYQTYGSASLSAYHDLCAWVPVTAATQYTASGYVYAGTNQQTCAIRIEWYQTYQGTFISASNGTSFTPTLGQWTQATSLTATAPAGATYALVRYQGLNNGSGSGNNIWINQQFEQGATATTYKGPFTSGTWTQTGIYNVTVGAIAAGGGGGASLDTNNYGSIPGIGGGGAAYNGATATGVVIGGAGSGMGTPVVPTHIRGAQNSLGGSSGSMSNEIKQEVPIHPTTGRGGSGTYWTYYNFTPYVNAGSASYGVDGYGGGGAGGIGAYISSALPYVEPHYTTGNAGAGGYAVGGGGGSGSSAVANSGCGGGGAAAGAASYSNLGKGGNGGSGKVIISYWGY